MAEFTPLCYCNYSRAEYSSLIIFLADIPELRPVLQNYLACGTKQGEMADFFSLNVYEWCGDSTYEGSGYSVLQQNASEYNIPIFVSETGCRVPRPRLFADQAAILGDNMTDTWSGAIVYEWIEEENNYGLISYGKLDHKPQTIVAHRNQGPKSIPKRIPMPLMDFHDPAPQRPCPRIMTI